ncbi:MAG: N-acetylmuramoyl-L-alanine amidase [bacterium]
MRIRDHMLEGEGVSHRETPNRGGIITPRYLVFHYTAARSAESAVEWLCRPEARASAHLVVSREGGVVQLAPFDVRTWHAGRSRWRGEAGLNRCTIGVELDNAGRLNRAGGRYLSWFQAEYPGEEVLRARHKNEGAAAFWHTYTEVQIGRALELARLLARTYALEDILGHEDIAPGRKSDPGPAFPLDSIRAAALGRADGEDAEGEVEEEGEEGDDGAGLRVAAEALNIRTGPGTGFGLAARPLPRGTRLNLLERRGGWSRVEPEDPPRAEGWVATRFLSMGGKPIA